MVGFDYFSSLPTKQKNKVSDLIKGGEHILVSKSLVGLGAQPYQLSWMVLNVNCSAPVTSSNQPNQLDVLLKHLNVVFSDSFLCFYLPLCLVYNSQKHNLQFKAFSPQFCQQKYLQTNTLHFEKLAIHSHT